MKKVLVLGAGGFIGTHLVTSLKARGNYVIGADLKNPEFCKTDADEFYIVDLADYHKARDLFSSDIDTVYQLAADMGGAGYVFTGENDANILTNNIGVNITVCRAMVEAGIQNLFYTSSACAYPINIQNGDTYPELLEEYAYPANPDSDYGWEKLTGEKLYHSYARNHGLRVRIARLHNIFGPLGAWQGSREKSPAALCRKVAQTKNGTIEVWGDGKQQRSYLYIDECIEGIHRIQDCDTDQPMNLGSERMVSINELLDIISKCAGNKPIKTVNIDGPLGVRSRTSNNTMLRFYTGWSPDENLEKGIAETYRWIQQQIDL